MWKKPKNKGWQLITENEWIRDEKKVTRKCKLKEKNNNLKLDFSSVNGKRFRVHNTSIIIQVLSMQLCTSKK